MNIDNKPIINHIDSVRHHNYYKNLEWVTHSENTRHGMKHGNVNFIHMVGQNNVSASLTDADVVFILEKFNDGYTSMQIRAAYFPLMSDSVFSSIKRGKAWKHIPRNTSTNFADGRKQRFQKANASIPEELLTQTL